jgi:predicted amidophosphoribosyltransferase
VGCQLGGGALCGECGTALLAEPRLAWPTPAPPGLPPPYAIADYGGAVRAAILAYKEHHRRGLLRPLCRALSAAAAIAWTTHAPPRRGPAVSADPVWSAQEVLLVAVPSTRAAIRARGHDPAAGLAQATARELRRRGLPAVRYPVLRHARIVDDQAGLSAAARTGNLAGALVVPRPLRRLVAGRRIMLIDDVVTTGATLAEAARSLRLAGADPVAAAVIAATRRHGSSQHPHLASV